jgi:FHS family L-fucose permease-like MFS transporter
MLTTQSAAITAETPGQFNSRFAFWAMTSLFFIWGFITALNDILLPYLKGAFSLSYLQAALVQFCFFGAYFLVSPVAGRLLEKVGYRKGILTGLVIIASGCCLFYPAAELGWYSLFLLALFVLASGITVLQVSANPYVAVLGDEQHAASRLSLAQAVNSVGHTAGPLFGAVLILAATGPVGSAKSVQLPYLLLACALLLTAALFYRLRLPDIKQQSVTEQQGTFSLSRYPQLKFGVLAIFLYVGAEVAVGSYLVNFFMQLGLTGMTEVTAGAMVSYYWGAAMVGRFVGAALMRLIRPAFLLALNSAFAVLMILLAVNSSGELALWTILAVGFFNSIMFPTIFTLAIRGLAQHTGRASGYLCQGIVGGAALPLLQGVVADLSSVQWSFLVPACCYVYIAWYGLAGCKTQPGCK